MKNIFSNNYLKINLYKKNSKKSEVVSQMIYGESFIVLKQNKQWLKIKIKEDGYVGYIIKKKYSNYIRPTHKVCVLKAKIYKKPSISKKINELTFGSKIMAVDTKAGFTKFHNKWIKNKDIKILKFKNKDFFKNIKTFKNVKYLWGGKTFNGLDCSALVQIFLNFNNINFPRDAKDQAKYIHKKIKLKDIKKNDILFWKGHVAIALSKKNLIHAYGPMKKTVIMNINKTIKKIKSEAKLDLISVKRLKG